MIAQPKTLDPTVVQQVLLGGDLSRLTADQRVSFYARICESLGLNPLTQPFAYLKLNGKEVLYAKKDATEQLRFLHGISIDPKTFTREVIEGVYVVTAAASMPSGRTDVSTGAVPIDGLKGENRANAMMKAETKAKRRVTLSICGLGMLDETEVDSIRQEPVEAINPIATQPFVEVPAIVVKEREDGLEPMTKLAGKWHAKFPPMPEGTCRILKVSTKRNGAWLYGDVTIVDPKGEESHVIAKGEQMCSLLEQAAQNNWLMELDTVLVKPTGGKEPYLRIETAERRDKPVEAPLVDVKAEDLSF